MTDQERIEELESIVGVGKNDIARDAFFSFCKVVDMQSKRLKKFNLDTEIVKDAKEDKVYDRTMDIVVKMPKMITDLISLRDQLKISNKEIQEAFVDSIAQPRK